MTHKEFLTAFLGRTLNIPADKVASLLNDDGTEIKPEALTELLALDATRVQNFKTENQTYFDNGFKKAEKEAFTKREKEIKEKYGITSDKIGLELIEEIITAKAGAKVELEEDKVKLHPAFVTMQDQLNKKIRETETTWKEKYEGYEKTIAKEKTFEKVFKDAETELAGLKPILPKDAAKAAAQKGWFKDRLNKYGYVNQNGTTVITDENGKALEDGHGNRITFKALVQQIANEYWEFEDGTERGGSGGDNDAGGKGTKGTPYKGKVPTSEAEYSAAFSQCKNAEERIALTDAWEAKQAEVSGAN